MGVLELRDVGLEFPGKPEPVLSGVSLDLQAGEFVTVVGPSGCGKTTMLRLVHGLLSPTAGEVLADGEPVRGPSTRRGFVFQNDRLLPWRTVIDNVGFPLELQGVPRAKAREKARELLTLTGMGDSESRYPGQLSGGMRQRVNLARALSLDPDLLLMDEPFAALDAQTREVLQAELLSIWARRRKTILFVTHQLDEAIYLADRVVVLDPHPGRIREIIPVDLPRPRTLDVKRTAEFAASVEYVWNLIKHAILAERRVD
ncbi:ABC transporter ATP-binding protein [Rhizohabitans arisaemae]|uniref:ABC transporter ATP-binding protein n=1 Tax=Rhizohabitans arisaemae TaxID=2720610 RepID=UPI0024B18FAC|nr:ABC transporter ATP-binding protein [Rhizohabitans arisaemae]